MIRSNIKGLATVLNKLSNRIDLLEKYKPEIKGGVNTTVRQTGKTFTINSLAEGGGGGSVSIYYPWRIYMYTEPTEGDAVLPEDKKKYIRCKGGLVNGVLPNNIDTNLAEAGTEAVYYVYLNAEFNGVTIDSLSLEASTVSTAPNLEYSYSQGSPPQNFRHLIGVVSEQSVTDQYLRKNLKVRPVIAYRESTGDTASIIENFWSWDVFPL